MKNNIISLSGGKDSTAVVHLMLELGIPIHSAVWYVTPWEFPEMHNHIDLIKKNTGITIVKLYQRKPWSELITRYKWPSIGREWCTREKINAVNRYIGSVGADTVEFIGFAADEFYRTLRPSMKTKKHHVRFPLIEEEYTEKMALDYCYHLGYHWGGGFTTFTTGCRVTAAPKKDIKG